MFDYLIGQHQACLLLHADFTFQLVAVVRLVPWVYVTQRMESVCVTGTLWDQDATAVRLVWSWTLKRALCDRSFVSPFVYFLFSLLVPCGFVDTCILSHMWFPSFFLVFSLLCPRHFVPSCRQPFLPFYPRPFVCLVVRVFISSFLCVFVSSAFFAFVLSSLRLFGCLCLYFFVPSCLRVLVLSCLIDFVRFSFHF